MRLNLGSGMRLRPGFYNVDHLPLPNVDILADLNEPLSALPDNSVEEIYCRHTLEHVTRFLELLAELHRVTSSQGRIEIIVPHFSNPYGYSDPTHVRFFGLYSFFYFCDEADQPRRKVPSFYLPQRFQVESVSCRLLKETVLEKVLRAVLQPLINRSPGSLDWYERRLCRWLPANDIRFLLRPKKEPSAGPRSDLRSREGRVRWGGYAASL
ncbi:MAG: methyltransferase domain-containing protein [Planctomycetes bacterium]|nr:methyltransferase domain-containing protein [Planctomycetota bacterium]